MATEQRGCTEDTFSISIYIYIRDLALLARRMFFPWRENFIGEKLFFFRLKITSFGRFQVHVIRCFTSDLRHKPNNQRGCNGKQIPILIPISTFIPISTVKLREKSLEKEIVQFYLIC